MAVAVREGGPQTPPNRACLEAKRVSKRSASRSETRLEAKRVSQRSESRSEAGLEAKRIFFLCERLGSEAEWYYGECNLLFFLGILISTLLVPQSRSGDKSLKFRVILSPRRKCSPKRVEELLRLHPETEI